MFSKLLRRSSLILLMQALAALADDDLAAIEEVAVLPQGFSPRFFDGALPIQQLGRRQDTGTCPNGSHNCAEIGDNAANKCCGVNQYCYYDADWNVGCCGLGTTCDPYCTSTSYRTNTTMTVTTTITMSATGSDATITGIGTLIVSTLTATSPGCVARACAVSAYQCPSSMGHGCCANSQICASSGKCLDSISITPTLVPTRGCSGTRSATNCPSDGGCCLQGQTCVSIGGTLGCTGTADAPAGTNGTITTNGGLSQGAKAGIGAGVAIGAAIVIGALTWFCVRRRRDARTPGSRTRNSRGPTPGPDSTNGGVAGMAGMSEVSGQTGFSRVHRNGTTYEYLGPNAVPGPYTQHDDDLNGHDPNSDVNERGVPASGPQDPSDIRHPVEMDTTKPTAVARKESTKSAATRRSEAIPPQGENHGLLYELEGSPFPEPSPMSPEELPSAQSQTPGSSQFFTPANPDLISPQGGTIRNDYLGEGWNEKK